MLFNSYQFIFLYLPTVFLGFFFISRISRHLAILWLGAASLFFYGWWNPKFVLLLLASIIFNYGMGYAIGHLRIVSKGKALLTIAIGSNLALLGYFKYANFFINTIDGLADGEIPLTNVTLPLGISFFTFTQIAFLVDVYRGIAHEYRFIHYLLFVSYFPHLIAGPILHHKQIIPQFADPVIYQVRSENVALGLIIFTIGLAKKVLLADSFAEYANPIFDATQGGVQPGLVAAWTGALAYTLQIYFDFSGYSDMAIGASHLFNIEIPINFNSPYKSKNIIEFWRRWHITLSQFLKDYLYIPLGGNRHGKIRRYENLIVTMLLGGLWHGANWTFVAWGGLHGFYLLINHAWHEFRTHISLPSKEPSYLSTIFGSALTFVLVVVAWVFFRAESFHTAFAILKGMGNIGEFKELYPKTLSMTFEGIYDIYKVPQDSGGYVLTIFSFGLGIVWLLQNTQKLSSYYRFSDYRIHFFVIGMLCFCIFMLVTINASRGISEFIYFNF